LSALELLLTRRSVMSKDMISPGPSKVELDNILKAGHRVPDHGKLGPWRFVVFEGNARSHFGEELAKIYAKANPDSKEAVLDFQRSMLMRAPLVIAVISTAGEHVKIPEWEQVLSAGACCQNMLLAAHAQGYCAQWLTEWYSFNGEVAVLLNLKAEHRIAGFIYIGSSEKTPEERVRPDLNERVTYWQA